MPEVSFVPARELLGEGDYYIEERTYSRVDFSLPSRKSALLRNLQVIRGVGPVTEGKLRDEGYEDIELSLIHIF